MSTYRVSSEEVSNYLRDWDTSIDLNLFIEMANTITDRVVAKDTASVLTTAEKKQIERCLAGHFYRTRDHGLATEGNERASGNYTDQFGKGLEATREGRDAILFDATGYLAKVSKGSVKATLNWLGKIPSEQTNYVDRG